jgi:predicted dienelactone hydrolase
VTSRVTVRYDVWRDTARGRDVPVKAYLPAAPRRCPLIVFSHGLGWSRDSYRYFGELWASHGYLCLNVEHPGTDLSLWRKGAPPLGELRRLSTDPQVRLDRVLDVRFALDRLPQAPWGGRADLGLVGVAGHSYGAHTVLTLAGQAMTMPDGRAGQARDPRVRAMLLLSPAPPRDPPGLSYGQILSAVAIPGLHVMGGTHDRSPMGFTDPAERRVPYDHIHGADQYLLVLDGARHATFSREFVSSPDDPDRLRVLTRTGQVSLTFWDAVLRGDTAARTWLRGGVDVAEEGSWEWKEHHQVAGAGSAGPE